MIIDYIGQELIWNLTATHPYKQNHRNYSIMIRCQTPLQNYQILKFFTSHLNGDGNVHYVNCIDINTGLKISIVDKITVPDALDGFGEVKFMNEFAKEIKE